jgi:carbamoyl-phosphate synthase large subunit
MNILFTCAGRRNYLLQYFREVLKHNGKIIAADMQITAPAMVLADKAIVVPGVYSSEYVNVILDICRKEQVHALLSLNDLELPILASEIKRFKEIGVNLIVSNEKVIETCFDKYKTIHFCEQQQIDYPKSFLTLNHARDAFRRAILKFPVVVKPRWGSASIGIEFPGTMEELELAYRLVSLKVSNGILFEASKLHLDQSVMIQEKIDGIEYGLDILNDFSGRPVQVYVKEKLAMRAGETDKAVLRNKPDLEELGLRIGRALGHIGNLDCDVFESNGKYYLLEMNPRFGGGYPFSHMSGANYPAAICSWIEGHTFNFAGFKKMYDEPYAKCDVLIKILK